MNVNCQHYHTTYTSAYFWNHCFSFCFQCVCTQSKTLSWIYKMYLVCMCLPKNRLLLLSEFFPFKLIVKVPHLHFALSLSFPWSPMLLARPISNVYILWSQGFSTISGTSDQIGKCACVHTPTHHHTYIPPVQKCAPLTFHIVIVILTIAHASYALD